MSHRVGNDAIAGVKAESELETLSDLLVEVRVREHRVDIGVGDVDRHAATHRLVQHEGEQGPPVELECQRLVVGIRHQPGGLSRLTGIPMPQKGREEDRTPVGRAPDYPGWPRCAKG